MKRSILLNPGPATTTDHVKQAQIIPDICPRESEFGDLMHSICDGLLEIGNGKENYSVALFGSSGTGAMEATLTSAIGKEDRVLIVTNGAYGIRMVQICENYGIDHDTIFEYGDYPAPQQILSALATKKHTHLAFIHHETSTGMMDPLEEIIEVCKSSNVISIVDAMSTFGAFPYDLDTLGVDYIFSSSNKCIQGMAGLSFVLFRNSEKEALKDNGRSYYFDVYKQWENLEKKNQLRFTPPVQTCYAFLAAIQETLDEGVTNRWARYHANWQILYDGLTQLGLNPLLPIAQESKILLALKLEGNMSFDFDHFHDYLFTNGITIYPGVMPEMATFRVAIIGDLHEDDMRSVMNHINTYFQNHPLILT